MTSCEGLWLANIRLVEAWGGVLRTVPLSTRDHEFLAGLGYSGIELVPAGHNEKANDCCTPGGAPARVRNPGLCPAAPASRKQRSSRGSETQQGPFQATEKRGSLATKVKDSNALPIIPQFPTRFAPPKSPRPRN